MAKSGDGTGFREEAAGDGGVRGELGVDDLDRHAAVEGGVGRQEDDSHAAPAQLPLQPVLRRERALEGGERVERRVAHAGTGREDRIREYTEPPPPLDAPLPKNVAPGGVSGCFGLNPN